MVLNSYMPVKLVTGAGCVRKSAKELAKLGKTCLIVTHRRAALEICNYRLHIEGGTSEGPVALKKDTAEARNRCLFAQTT